jgi:hypothetical protein
VRAYVDDAGTGYSGKEKSAVLEPLPPVSYENRYAVDDQMSGMRFAGWYYLAVHLGAEMADKFGDGPFALTLRVRVSGAAEAAPAYSGATAPRGLFEVTAGDKDAADSGAASAGESRGSDRSTAMKAVAAGGIGAGVVLVLGLGMWTVVARRRAARTGTGAVAGAGAVAVPTADAAARNGAASPEGMASREYEPPRGS